jgi:hypothetical protein
MTTLVGLVLAVVVLLVPGWPPAADFKLKLPRASKMTRSLA